MNDKRIKNISKWLTCTSQGGGALLYDGTILKVTDPRASLCKNTQVFNTGIKIITWK